jgi:hypothetical protein
MDAEEAFSLDELEAYAEKYRLLPGKIKEVLSNPSKAHALNEFMRFSLGMTYKETLREIQKIDPSVTPGQWEEMLKP